MLSKLKNFQKYAADELAKFLLPEVSKAMTADGFDCASIEKLIKVPLNSLFSHHSQGYFSRI